MTPAPRRARRGRGDAGPSRADIAADPEADPYEVARRIVLDQLMVRARSRAELAERLSRRNVPEQVATAVLDRMEEVMLVDDRAFADQWVTSRHRSRGLGRRHLAQELRRKGVDPELAREALDRLEPEQEERTAAELVARKLGSTRGLDPQRRAARLAGMLARKGYPSGVAYRVVREALAAEGEDPEQGLPFEN